MKVIHLCLGKANPQRMNGVNKVVHALSSEQIKQGVEVEVWGITGNPEGETPPRPYPLKLFKGHGRFLKMPVGMSQAIEGLPSDTVVHIHGVLITVFYTVARALEKRGIKWVLAPHGAYNAQSLKYRAWLKWPFIVLLDRFLIRHAKAIHVGTMGEAAPIRWLSGQTPVVTINNGFNPDDESAGSEEVATPRHPVFGFVGRLAANHKGLDLLIDGFASYLAKGGQGALWLVGDGSDRGVLEGKVQKYGIGDRVIFHGSQFGVDKFAFINAMDIFVHTSRWEVMPIAILEAAGFSTPVLLSKATNLTSHTARWDAGFVLEENTPEMIAQTMLSIDKSLDTLPEKGSNARAMVLAEFSWGSIATKLMQEVYTQ